MVDDTEESNPLREVMLPNVSSVLKLARTLQERRLPGLPFGVVYGSPGFGKTKACEILARTTGAGHIECRETWTRRDLVNAMATCLGIGTETSITRTIDAVGLHLIETGKLLIIDEAHIPADRNMFGVFHDLEKSCNAPILFVGEQNLPAKMRRFERMDDRVLEWCPMEPATLEDARELALVLAEGVTVADDLLGALVKLSHGRVRRIVANLNKIYSEAIIHGASVVDRRWWGERPLHVGKAPSPPVWRPA